MQLLRGRRENDSGRGRKYSWSAAWKSCSCFSFSLNNAGTIKSNYTINTLHRRLCSASIPASAFELSEAAPSRSS